MFDMDTSSQQPHPSLHTVECLVIRSWSVPQPNCNGLVVPGAYPMHADIRWGTCARALLQVESLGGPTLLGLYIMFHLRREVSQFPGAPASKSFRKTNAGSVRPLSNLFS